jgi:hypothetical protein
VRAEFSVERNFPTVFEENLGTDDWSGQAGISPDDLVIVAVGLTASRTKRQLARRGYGQRLPCRVYLPWLPYFLGLRLSAAWLSYSVRRQMAKQPRARLHLIVYFGGGVLVRMLQARGEKLPISRVVWNRGLAQERVAPAVAERMPSFVLTLLGRRSVVDLARLKPERLPYPAAEQSSGVIVEAEASALARRLGVGRAPLKLSPDDLLALVPGASAAIAVPLSHDDVYSDPRFLDQAAAFISTGAFLSVPQTERT